MTTCMCVVLRRACAQCCLISRAEAIRWARLAVIRPTTMRFPMWCGHPLPVVRVAICCSTWPGVVTFDMVEVLLVLHHDLVHHRHAVRLCCV